MKKILVSRLFVLGTIGLCTCASAWAQRSHTVVGAKGNKIHVHFNAATEAQSKGKSNGQGASGGVGFAKTTTNMVYGGGPVMRNPTNYLIFWQPPGRAAFPAGYVAGMEKFFQSVGGTPFYAIVTQYNDTTGAPVPNSTSLGAPSFSDGSASTSGCTGAPGPITGPAPNCPLTDGDVQDEVSHAISVNPAWGAPNVNKEYFVFTPSDVNECLGLDKDGINQDCFIAGPKELSVFCAYHSFFSGNTVYAYMPYAPLFAQNGCGGSTPYPNSVAVDVEISPVSHEMFESNTDPLINAWTGTGGGDDEIGDKCAYDYGFIAANGVNIVLNGFPVQIQREFSNNANNDLGVGNGCTKRDGPAAVLSDPGTLKFGEVASGKTSEMDLLVQNNGGGDLNILNVRLGSGSSGFYSLLNVPPGWATLKTSESLTVKVQFAPTGGFIPSPSATVVVDTDVTTSPADENTTAVTGDIGVPPNAFCHDVTVNTDPNLCSTSNASINNGSNDPDGEGITLTQSPAGPYQLGSTNVNLTVTDTGADHQTAFCSAHVIVQDHQNPTITCPAPQTLSCTSPSGAAATLTPSVFDNCPAVTSVCAPTSGSTFGPGTTPVTCTATDASGNHNSCATSVTVNDVAPTIASIVAFPNVLTPPNKKLDPVVLTVKASDVCDAAPPVCSITGVTANVPISPGDFQFSSAPGTLNLKLRANGNGGHTLTYVVTVACVSSFAGATTTGQVSVSAPAH